MKASIAWFLFLFALAAFCTPSFAFEDVDVHPACAICGMDRNAFGHSRMLIEFGGGRTFGTCSLRCAAVILQAEDGKKVRSVKVADYDTRELFEAEEATWVIGGKMPGVMTRVAKWAFLDVMDADRFLAEFGGARSTYGEALREAIREIR
jgi:nitrous oxide reductase accessory protein NosL